MMDKVLLYFISTMWNVLVLGVTAYAVFWLGHSGWWFLLAVLLLHSFKSKSEKDDKD